MVKKKRYIEPMAKSWVEDATKLIKFKDDRLRVQAELLDHIEDAADAWKEAGYDDYEAKKKAVSNMGDAAEVANNLADIYRPFWGRLWKLTKWLRNLAILNLIVYLISTNYYTGVSTEFGNLTGYAEHPIFTSHPEEKLKLNGYEITLHDVQTVKYKDKNGTEIIRTDMIIQATSLTPYKRGFSFLSGLTAHDDAGNFYPLESHYLWRDKNDTLNGHYLYSNSSVGGQRQNGYIISLHPYEAAKEITIVFDLFGETFRFTTPIRMRGADNE